MKKRDVPTGSTVHRARAARLLGITAVASLLGACASFSVPINKTELAYVRRAPHIQAVALSPQTMRVITPGSSVGMLFGAIGAAVAINHQEDVGNNLIRTDHIPNPTISLQHRLARGLARHADLRNILIDPRPLSSGSLDTLRSRYGKTGVVLTVGTIVGNLAYNQENHSRYQLFYRGYAKLTRLSDGKTLWKSACAPVVIPAKGSKAPTLAAEEAHKGAWIKKAFSSAVAVCATDIVKRFPVS